ncbi:MAG: hypothetical protein QOE14_1792 [Humisphaera sp.]|nr:hypothetical protein [Humisphaera sp.]
MKKSIHVCVAIFLALVSLLGGAAPTRASARPNLVIIMTDDQARWALGCYGNRECQTPNMDRLARDGARFTNAFVVTPVCSPSRASFFTGKYGTQLGITDWIMKNESAAGVGLSADVPNWPRTLQRAGYVTALIGKWHLGENPQFHPTKVGFSHFFGFLGGGQFPMNPTLEQNGKEKKFDGPIPDILTDDALTFLNENRSKEFALCLFFREPHQPYEPAPPQDAAVYKDLDPTVPKSNIIDAGWLKDRHRAYYASVHAADRNIGRVLDKLDELKLADNTIVLFTSDHGYNIGHHGIYTKGNAAFIAGKGVHGPKRPNMFENSIRVPLIVRWPGVVKPGTEIGEMVSNIDSFATILGMTGIAMPADVKQHGVDFSPLLRDAGAVEKFSSRDLYGQYDLHNAGFASMRMIRSADGAFKLVRHHLTNGLNELYDLKNDPHEQKNLYNDPAARATRDALQEKLTAWQKSIDDPISSNPLNTRSVGGSVDVR